MNSRNRPESSVHAGAAFGPRAWRTLPLFSGLIALALLVVLGTACAPDSGGSSAGSASGPLDADQMKEAVDEMLGMTDTLDRNRRAIELVDALTDENLSGAIAGYERDLTRLAPKEGRLFANAWAKRDPQAAVEHLLEWPYPKIMVEAVEEAVYVWARSDDAASARAFVDPSMNSDSIQGRSPNKFMVLAVLKALGAAEKFDELTGLLESLEDDPGRELLLTQVMIEMNRANGLTSVKDWIKTIPWDAKNDLKVGALKRAIDWTSKLSARGGAAWYEEIESHPRAKEILPSVLAGWGVRAPQEVIPWLAERPATPVRDVLMRETAVGWLSRKPKVAEEWLLEHLDDSETIRAQMLMPLANLRLAQRRYADSVAYLEEVPNEQERDYGYSVVLVEWSRLDEAAVEEYIAEGKVSDEVVAKVREKLAKAKVNVKRRTAKAADSSGQDGDEG